MNRSRVVPSKECGSISRSWHCGQTAIGRYVQIDPFGAIPLISVGICPDVPNGGIARPPSCPSLPAMPAQVLGVTHGRWPRCLPISASGSTRRVAASCPDGDPYPARSPSGWPGPTPDPVVRRDLCTFARTYLCTPSGTPTSETGEGTLFVEMTGPRTIRTLSLWTRRAGCWPGLGCPKGRRGWPCCRQ